MGRTSTRLVSLSLLGFADGEPDGPCREPPEPFRDRDCGRSPGAALACANAGPVTDAAGRDNAGAFDSADDATGGRPCFTACRDRAGHSDPTRCPGTRDFAARSAGSCRAASCGTSSSNPGASNSGPVSASADTTCGAPKRTGR